MPDAEKPGIAAAQPYPPSAAAPLSPVSPVNPTPAVLETGVMTITLITGANKGLGYETARRLIDLGHTVLVGARDPQRGTTAARELGATFIPIGPTDDGSVQAAAARVRNE